MHSSSCWHKTNVLLVGYAAFVRCARLSEPFGLSASLETKHGARMKPWGGCLANVVSQNDTVSQLESEVREGSFSISSQDSCITADQAQSGHL